MSSKTIIVSGPSGVGKTTIIHEMCERYSNFTEAIACTTRPPRQGEVEGKDYYFLDEETFSRFLAADSFYIFEKYAGYNYGILKSELENNKKGFVFLNIGLPSLKLIPAERRKEALTIYMMPSCLSDLKRWMADRGAERMEVARDELSEVPNYFDYLVINRDGQLEGSIMQILHIVQPVVPNILLLKNNLQFLAHFYD